jgi:deoxyribodipyrimidine photo-lyase
VRLHAPSLLPTSTRAPPPADNYCFYVVNYDSLDAAYDWAKQTLNDHRTDKREHLYTRRGECAAWRWQQGWRGGLRLPAGQPAGACAAQLAEAPHPSTAARRQQFEAGETHDKLWNAAQLEMVHAGKMHGFMRMYWAKKILEVGGSRGCSCARG